MSEKESHSPSDQQLGSSEPYHKAARFAGEAPALRAYTQAQELIFSDEERADLSAYRFQINRVYHVAVLGKLPPEDLQQRLEAILAAGEPAALPPTILQMLRVRRMRASGIGPWVEGHYRPGKRL